MIHFLHWIFRQHLATVLLTAVTLFFALTIGFGLLIWFAGSRHPYCIGGVEFDADHFADAYTLSWTTFSTVVSICKRYRRRASLLLKLASRLTRTIFLVRLDRDTV